MFFGDLAQTGFGTVTQDLGRALLDIGHDVRFVSQNDLGDIPEPFASRTFAVNDPAYIDPDKAHAFGDNSLSLTTRGVAGLLDGSLWSDTWVPEVAVLLGDYRAAELVVMADERTIAAFSSIPTFHYVPIEGVDLPPSWSALWKVVRPVAMSEFGADQIEYVTGTRPPMVYHGVDTDVFRPLTPKSMLRLGEKKVRDKATAKRFFGGNAKSRWLFRADRLMPRKQYGSLLRALVPVLAERPDVFLVIHCRAIDQGGNLHALRSKYHPSIAARIILTGMAETYGPMPRELLVAMYNAADVYVSVSAEGFGLTVAEAMACGVPAVGMAYSAVPEVIGPGGLTAPVDHLIDNEYDHAWAVVNEQAFGAQVARLLDDEPLRAKLGAAAREHIRGFSWAAAAQQFSALFQEAT